MGRTREPPATVRAWMEASDRGPWPSGGPVRRAARGCPCRSSALLMRLYHGGKLRGARHRPRPSTSAPRRRARWWTVWCRRAWWSARRTRGPPRARGGADRPRPPLLDRGIRGALPLGGRPGGRAGRGPAASRARAIPPLIEAEKTAARCEYPGRRSVGEIEGRGDRDAEAVSVPEAVRRPAVAAVIVLVAGQAIAELYLPTLMADIVDRGRPGETRRTSCAWAGSCCSWPSPTWCSPWSRRSSPPRSAWDSAATCGRRSSPGWTGSPCTSSTSSAPPP